MIQQSRPPTTTQQLCYGFNSTPAAGGSANINGSALTTTPIALGADCALAA